MFLYWYISKFVKNHLFLVITFVSKTCDILYQQYWDIFKFAFICNMCRTKFKKNFYLNFFIWLQRLLFFNISLNDLRILCHQSFLIFPLARHIVSITINEKCFLTSMTTYYSPIQTASNLKSNGTGLVRLGSQNFSGCIDSKSSKQSFW